ncbi:MAG: polysaccharide pyruvyl transferase family protein, partial [Steroidobacteraceae bacterium]
MKVFYHKTDGANVGDDMNAELWHRLIPDLDEVASAQWLVGAGTIIDARLEALPGRKIIMGAGVRPGARRAALNEVRFAAVRGYHSAAHLGLEPEVAACDPGFLVNRVWPQHTQTRTRIGFVPHVYSEQYSSIAAAAADAGLEVISPTLPIEAFLQRLVGCARIYSESLHGAIFADALRIPWARVCVCSIHYERSAVANFKWSDAFSVLGLSATHVGTPALLPLKRSWTTLRGGLRPVQAFAERRLVRSLLDRRDDERLFQLSDAARLDERIEMLASRVTQIGCPKQVERWPTVRRKTADSSLDAATVELRVLAFPKRGENAYLESFAESLEGRGAVVDEFTFWRTLLKRYDVVHMHWPDTHLRTHSWWRAIGKHIRLGGTCLVLRLRGSRIVWMMHNIKPHEKDHWISRALFPWWFPRVCTNVMALTQKGLSAAHACYPLLR